VTGSPIAVGRMAITFDDDADSEAISANTCGRQLILSSSIQDKEVFIAAMIAVIPKDSKPLFCSMRSFLISYHKFIL